MKYGTLTLGQIEAIVNKLGGMEGVRRFLADECRVEPVGLRAKSTFVIPLDNDLPERLQTVAVKWRCYAAELGYSGPVAWRVKAGFTLKKHAPLAGPCYNGLAYLQGWQFDDTPTQNAIVFWIPWLVPESTSKNVAEQKALLGELRTRLELPDHHMSSFGSVALNTSLIFAHFKRTGERVPLDLFWVRTDTRSSDGNRILLVFDTFGLSCGYWSFGEVGYGHLGVFALGVELEQ